MIILREMGWVWLFMVSLLVIVLVWLFLLLKFVVIKCIVGLILILKKLLLFRWLMKWFWFVLVYMLFVSVKVILMVELDGFLRFSISVLL